MSENPFAPPDAITKVGSNRSFFDPTIIGASAIGLSLCLFFCQAWTNHSAVTHLKATVAHPHQADFVHALKGAPDFAGGVLSLYVFGLICFVWKIYGSIKNTVLKIWSDDAQATT